MKTDLMLAVGIFLLGFCQILIATWMRSQMKINGHTHKLFVLIGRRLDRVEKKK